MAAKWISVTGSRYYPFTKVVWDTLKPEDQLESIQKGIALVKINLEQMPKEWGIVSGGAKGPDTWAETIAHEQGREVVIYPAEWERLGMGAGLYRNRLIAQHADSCLVFWDGESRGTNDFIKKAYRFRKPLYIVGPTGTPWAIFDEDYWANIGEDEPPKMDIPGGS